jgi:HEAT repeat protein
MTSEPSGIGLILRLAASKDPVDAARLERLLAEADDRLLEELVDCLDTWHGGHAASIALGLVGARILPLAERRASQKGYVNRSLLWTLAHVRDPRSVALAVKSLEVGDPEAQEGAASALGELGDTSAVPALRRALASPSRAVRAEAASALQMLGDGTVLPVLLELSQHLTDEPDLDFDELRGVFTSLGAIGGPTAVQRLSDALGVEPTSYLALEGFHALATDHPAELAGVAGVLGACLRDPRWHVVNQVLEILAMAPHEAFGPALVTFLKELDPAELAQGDLASEVLSTIGGREATQAVTGWHSRRKDLPRGGGAQ